MANDLQKRLAGLGACDDALTWIGNRTLSRAWAECERADWMLWIASRLDGRCGWPDLTVVVRAACSCAAASAAASAAAEAGSAAEAAEHRAMCKIIRRIIKPGRLPR